MALTAPLAGTTSGPRRQTTTCAPTSEGSSPPPTIHPPLFTNPHRVCTGATTGTYRVETAVITHVVWESRGGSLGVRVSGHVVLRTACRVLSTLIAEHGNAGVIAEHGDAGDWESGVGVSEHVMRRAA